MTSELREAINRWARLAAKADLREGGTRHAQMALSLIVKTDGCRTTEEFLAKLDDEQRVYLDGLVGKETA